MVNIRITISVGFLKVATTYIRPRFAYRMSNPSLPVPSISDLGSPDAVYLGPRLT